MKIGIIGAIGVDDIGDVVMLESGLKQLKDAGRKKSINVDFTVFTLDKKKTRKQLEEINIKAKVSNCLTAKDLDSQLHEKISFKTLLKINLIHAIDNNEFICSFKECDALFFIGGGYFNSYWKPKFLPILMIPIALGYKFNKPIFISGVNIGPFSEEEISDLNGLFKKIDILTLRDRVPSIETLEKLGGTEGKLILGADDILPRWYNNDYKYPSMGIEDDGKYVVVQLHHWVETYSMNYIEFYKELAAFLNEVLNNKTVDRIYFLPFTYFKGADYECGRRLKTFMDDREEYIVLEPTNNHVFMREFISKSEFIVGSRYHPVIYGLGERVPTLGIYVNDLYKQKISGAYDVMEIEKETNMIYINDISEKRLMEWYINIASNINIEYCGEKKELINKYALSRKRSIADFVGTIE